MVLLRAPERATHNIHMKYQNFRISSMKISKSQYLTISNYQNWSSLTGSKHYQLGAVWSFQGGSKQNHLDEHVWRLSLPIWQQKSTISFGSQDKELTRPRLTARLIADGTGVCFIYLHETRVFGFLKDVSPASTLLDSQKKRHFTYVWRWSFAISLVSGDLPILQQKKQRRLFVQ